MPYQVLARKWRPQDFSGLIGQEPIVTALRNALTEGRIAQAYLFSGIRGVGKTTTARLLAKALNCEQGPTAEPCNQCTPCQEIARGADLDVLEVDAATYSKVEQVRELVESLKYGPARDRYKVAVLDEIHRLSRQAFDALLKIVEEPPAHLVFVFATTEIEMVPATVLSRCQEFHFRRVPSNVVAEHLRRLATSEDIETSDTALRLIARAGEGSVRDAVALLDQLATFGGGSISDDEAVRLLGGLDIELFRELLSGIVEGRRESVGRAVSRVEEEGWDPRTVHAQFLAYCRDGLHLALGGDPAKVDLPEEEARALAELARSAGYENLLRLSQQLLASEPTVRRSEAGALALEIAWLRAAELPNVTRIEELIAGGAVSETGSKADSAGSSPAKAPSRPEPAAPPPSAPPAPAAAASEKAPSEEPADEDTRADTGAGDSPPAGTVEAFRETVARRKTPLAARLDHCRLAWEDGVLRIEGPEEDVATLERSANRRALEDATREVWGPDAKHRLVRTETKTEAPEQPERNKEAPPSVTEDETVQTVLDLFGGTVEAVEEHDSVQKDERR